MSKIRGFTLVELLVVLVLLALLSGMVLLGTQLMANPQRLLQQEAQRLQMLLRVLLEEAVIEGREYGLQLTQQGYQVLQLDAETGRWQAQGTKAYQLPDAVALVLQVESRSVTLSTSPQGSSEAAVWQPQLLVLSSGEYTPFHLQLRGAAEQTLALQSDGFTDPQVISAVAYEASR